MPAIPLIAAGVSVVGSVASAGIQSAAAGRARTAQQAATDQATSALKVNNRDAQQALSGAYGQQQQLLSPYQALGVNALSRLTNRGLPPPQPGMVHIQAPTGQIVAVPQAQAPQAIAAGGKQV